MKIAQLFDISGRTAVVTGGGGALCSAMCRALADAGASVAVLDRSQDAAAQVADEINAGGGRALAAACDVLDVPALEAAGQEVLKAFGRVDILVNGAGGNNPRATTSPELSFFDLPADALNDTFALNFTSALYASQVFGRSMAQQKEGVIINIASMNAVRPLTRIPAYSAGKAALANFTQWLAVHMAQEVSPRIRVNAIAPGFFLTNVNRYLLVDEASGEASQRGRQILAHTPQGRLGEPQDLVGTLLWLVSDGAAFVTGVMVPVDGGFSAYSGV